MFWTYFRYVCQPSSDGSIKFLFRLLCSYGPAISVKKHMSQVYVHYSMLLPKSINLKLPRYCSEFKVSQTAHYIRNQEWRQVFSFHWLGSVHVMQTLLINIIFPVDPIGHIPYRKPHEVHIEVDFIGITKQVTNCFCLFFFFLNYLKEILFVV